MKALDHLDAGAPGAGSAVVAVGALGVVGKSLPFVAAAISNVHAVRFRVRIFGGKTCGSGRCLAPESEIVGGRVELPTLDFSCELDAVCVHLDGLVACGESQW